MTKANLIELKKGIWSFTNEAPPFEQEPIVLIHPFYQWSRIDGVVNYWKRGISMGTVYGEKLEQTIKEYDGPIITLEPEGRIEKVAEGFQWFGRKKAYFVETEPHSPLPVHIDLESLMEFIVQFSGDPIKLGGGYLWAKDWGCLGVFATLIKTMTLKSTVYVEGLIFEGLG